MKLKIPPALQDEMIKHSKKKYPFEACGFVVGCENRPRKFIPAQNEEKSEDRYRVDPQDLLDLFERLEKTGEKLWGIFHSHPKSPAFPSSLDIEQAYYPQSFYLILSLQNCRKPSLRAFSIKEGKVEEVEIIVRGDKDY